MKAKLIIGIVLLGLAVVFIVQNVAVMDLRFLFWTVSMSRALFVFLILAVGITAGWLLHSALIKRKKMRAEKAAHAGEQRKGAGAEQQADR
jgi:lipopolysaccharide assembly protein A